ncbi:hypothetical protein FOA52_006312 [Chlamydomonas sp. UWO 241]|nr:hypothetical protein FOA52_006312 [Chlamydomonas sp. UWO 241]
MGCCGKILLKIITIVLGIVKLACAVAIIAIIMSHLYDVSFVLDTSEQSYSSSCMLGTWGDKNLCDFAMAMSGISIAVDIAVFILLCCTCNLCGLGYIVELAFFGAGTVLWLATGIIITKQIVDTNNLFDGNFNDIVAASGNDDLDKWRNIVLGLAWGAFGCFGVLFLIYLGKMLSTVLSCCFCCADDDKGNKVHAETV